MLPAFWKNVGTSYSISLVPEHIVCAREVVKLYLTVKVSSVLSVGESSQTFDNFLIGMEY